MDAKKILFIAQEITPYLPESEIATICRNLPQGIQERGREIRTFIRKYQRAPQSVARGYPSVWYESYY